MFRGGQLAQLRRLPASFLCNTSCVAGEGFAEEEDRGNVRSGSYGCFGWEDACAQSHSLNRSMGLLQLAIRQVPSWGVRHLGHDLLPCHRRSQESCWV